MSPSPNDFSEDIEEIGLVPPGNGGGGTHLSSSGDDTPGATMLGVGGYNVNVDNRALPYFGLLAAATILLIATLVLKGETTNTAYGISVCAISMILGAFGVYMALMNQGLYDNPLVNFPLLGSLTWGSGLAYFLLVWNFIGASIFTFHGPFLVTSNGYFASWALVCFSLMALGVTTEAVRSQASTLGGNNGLLVAIIIQLCAVIPELGDGVNKGRCIYDLVLCIITIMVVLAFGAYPGIESLKLPVFSLFGILWLVMAALVTFKGPFIETGNGYFSAWAGFALTLVMASS
jgi:hypothetical protein